MIVYATKTFMQSPCYWADALLYFILISRWHHERVSNLKISDQTIQADGDLSEHITYGDHGFAATPQAFATVIKHILAQGARLGPRRGESRPLAFDALHGGNPTTIHAIALCGFDWRQARSEEGHLL